MRDAALARTEARGLGWALFLRRGMGAWGEACQALLPASPARPRTAPVGSQTTNVDVVRIVAAMVLAVAEEMRDGD